MEDKWIVYEQAENFAYVNCSPQVTSTAIMDHKDSIEYNEKAQVEQNVADISDAARRAERKLRLKIDLMVVPSVTLLYLLCFIDRTNIGGSTLILTRSF